MKLTRRQLRALIKEALEVHQVPVDLDTVDSEEAYGIGYMKGKEYSDPPTVEDAWYPSDVVPKEGSWSSGDNLDDPLDHTYFETGERNAGPHVTISEANSGVDPKTGRSWSISQMTGEKHWGGPARKDVEEQENAQAAIDNARNQRDDGLSFEDFARLVIDQLNLYDEWLGNTSVEDVVANLVGTGTNSDDWEPGPGRDASGIGESETNDGTPLNEMPASWQQILRTKS